MENVTQKSETSLKELTWDEKNPSNYLYFSEEPFKRLDEALNSTTQNFNEKEKKIKKK